MGVCVGGVVICGCLDNCVGDLELCVLVFTVFFSFMYIYSYLLLV